MSRRNTIAKRPLECPKCGGDCRYVKDSMVTELHGFWAFKRRRECSGCGARFSTFEMMEEDVPRVSMALRRQAVDKLEAAVRALQDAAEEVTTWNVEGETDDAR